MYVPVRDELMRTLELACGVVFCSVVVWVLEQEVFATALGS